MERASFNLGMAGDQKLCMDVAWRVVSGLFKAMQPSHIAASWACRSWSTRAMRIKPCKVLSPIEPMVFHMHPPLSVGSSKASADLRETSASAAIALSYAASHFSIPSGCSGALFSSLSEASGRPGHCLSKAPSGAAGNAARARGSRGACSSGSLVSLSLVRQVGRDRNQLTRQCR